MSHARLRSGCQRVMLGIWEPVSSARAHLHLGICAVAQNKSEGKYKCVMLRESTPLHYALHKS